MPLTEFQKYIAKLIAPNRAPESHLAGGAAIHLEPKTKRYSNDLDYFHDSAERVGEAFNEDNKVLTESGLTVDVVMAQPGFVRAIISDPNDPNHSTKVEWSHDSAWRFMPAVKVEDVGYQLHPIDLAINKLLALAGRDEPRDFLDILHVHDEVLPLGALCWAAVGKDPGFTPQSLLGLIRRRGKYREEDFSRLRLTQKVDLIAMKQAWLKALEEADAFISNQPPEQAGCLYYSTTEQKFVAPKRENGELPKNTLPHHGRPGGLLPQLKTEKAS